MDWNKFKTYDDYKAWVQGQTSDCFSFKVGVFNKHREEFTGLGYFFKSFFPTTPANKEEPPIETPLGKLTHRNLILEPGVLFENIENIPRQGDILTHGESFPYSLIPEPTHWIVVSQTCDIKNRPFVLLAPGFLYSTFEKNPASFGLKAESLGNMNENKVIRFLSFPPNDCWGDETLTFDLSQIHSLSSDLLKKAASILSLSMAANYYLQNRLGISLLRDVKDTDDFRTLSGNLQSSSEKRAIH